MKVKKQHLEIFFLTLRGTDGVLSLADARIRDAFMKPLGEAVDTMVADRTKIYEKFCDKDEDGKPDTAEGMYHFSPDIRAEADAELKTLMNEEADVEIKWGVTPAKIKEIMEKSDYKPKYGEAEVIDEIIKAL